MATISPTFEFYIGSWLVKFQNRFHFVEFRKELFNSVFTERVCDHEELVYAIIIKMNKLSLLLVVFLGLIAVLNGQKFNNFKNYANSKVRPEKYAKRSMRHAISEYLTPLQIKMMNAREGKDTPDVMFDNKWSGFNGFQPKPITRKLGDFETLLASHEAEPQSTFVPIYIMLGGIALVAASVMYWLLPRKVIATEEKGSEFV